MYQQILQASIWERDRKHSKIPDMNDLREPMRGDRERVNQARACASAGECATDTGYVQARAAHEWDDITKAPVGKRGIE